MQNKLRTLWNEDASAINAWLGIPSTITAEIVSKQGFDAITIDLQHGINDYSTAVPMLQAISACDATPMGPAEHANGRAILAVQQPGVVQE